MHGKAQLLLLRFPTSLRARLTKKHVQKSNSHVRYAIRGGSSGVGFPPEVDIGTPCTATSVAAKGGSQIVLRRARRAGRGESTACLGRALFRDRCTDPDQSQQRRPTAVGPWVDQLRYPGRG